MADKFKAVQLGTKKIFEEIAGLWVRWSLPRANP